MLQLGLLRVITWPGSQFKKQRIKAQILFIPTRSSWCSPNLNSVGHTLDLVWVFALIFQWWFWCWQFILNRQSFPFLLRVCKTSFLSDFLLSLSFLPELFPFLELQSAGCPSFVSPLYRFWLIGFLFWRIMTAFLYWLFGTITVFFFFVRTSKVPFVMHLDQLRTTLPQVMIKGFKFRKEKLLLLWLKGG